MTIKAPPITEAAFMAQITELATLRGWEWFHCRPARTLDSWRTPGSGTMARGWPDLCLVRGSRLIFMEVKRDSGKTTPEQDRVLNALAGAVTVYIVRPADWGLIESVLS